MTTLESIRTPAGGGAPHNIDAEESVIGAVMLSADAANVALEVLKPDDFYKPAHQSVWEAITALFDGNQPIDPVTVADWLRRKELLDRIGGVGFITRLMEAVPSTSNVDYYAGIVDETSARRRLLRAGSEVGALALKGDMPIDEVLDSAEAEVFAVAERRIGEGLAAIGPMLNATLERIEELGHGGGDVTGVPTGFNRLDQLLAGLHPANLIVIAARPGMGKSTLALNIATHVAAEAPVAVFTLEMSREEIIHRLLSSLASVDSSKIKTGQLDMDQWRRLSQASSKVFGLKLYVDDGAALTVTAIRAKCRRLKRREGLGLVVVDYLQLMQGPRMAENRQQEIADISRSLKNLARELAGAGDRGVAAQPPVGVAREQAPPPRRSARVRCHRAGRRRGDVHLPRRALQRGLCRHQGSGRNRDRQAPRRRHRPLSTRLRRRVQPVQQHDESHRSDVTRKSSSPQSSVFSQKTRRRSRGVAAGSD